MNVFFQKYVSVILAICLVLVLTVSVIACKDKNAEQTNPAETTAEQTTPAETTTKVPDETVTSPSEGDDDPKQEDVFYN